MLRLEDFKKDREKAKNWAKEKSEKWKKSLGLEEKRLLEDSVSFQRVNDTLEKNRGRYIKISSVRKNVDRLDKSLEVREAKLDDSIYVYRNLVSKELGDVPNSFYEKGKNTINREQYSQFENNFQYGVIHDFMHSNLTPHSGDQSYPVLLHLKVPKGESMGYLEEDQIFIGRNQGFEVKSMKIIAEKGRQVIKVKGELTSKGKVADRIKAVQTNLNDRFTSELGIEQNAIELNIDGFSASVMVHRTETLLEQFISHIPRNILVGSIEKMNQDVAFIFTDNSLVFYDGNPDDLGFYNPAKKNLIIQINHEGHILKKDEVINTLFHEFGHTVDDLLFDNISLEKEFNEIYEEKKDNITIEEYIKEDSVEFFGGVFGYLYSPNLQQREQIQREAPKTCEFIKNLVENYPSL
ncbi:ADP-ribosyltransferase [Paenibacillus larvae subsp. larvae]|uniref:ADP-ribosyltransferase n=1 Tax=Paenibacillus larvae TaxID=1464 RepID=UPI0023A9F9C0|nr:ADP-ribosyltransferase [Paenibacillus larvae]MDE5128066.1 ADP-ribosyltransferase [Paenibacillus larvae subsp. larvae]MDE5135637.1 ADP-ribosyltransferase [Paenibacillus larvae subsp. larvae]MDE5139616.1 ADP-ribosyltransferase [Paenibacillus larvae subsp. larvae]MDE5143925.1 ADP-ribosyltransferase [Paenibacillus larvae subsp. larvae]MDE5151689.1 ADP-ribosyltransferase [Paenibacillus larvae subsp. larvae]